MSRRDIFVRLSPEMQRTRVPTIIAGTQAAAQCVGVHYTEKTRALTPAAAGFILADTGGHPLCTNLEARKIVTYPEGPRIFPSAWPPLWEVISPLLGKQNSFFASTFRVEFMSGRREYVCLAIPLDKSQYGRPAGGSVAIVLERHEAASHVVAEMSERFRLTEREREVVELLIRGLPNKEIAGRMGISPNTVRAFVRMVMGKLGVSTRSGIVGMVFRGTHTPSLENGEQNRSRVN